MLRNIHFRNSARGHRRFVIGLLLVSYLALASALAQEKGPFGLSAGMTRKQVEQTIGSKAIVSEKGDDVTYSTAPNPHPDFETYTLTFSPRFGLVAVEASSRDIDDSDSLFISSQKCSEIAGALTAKYGNPMTTQTCALKWDKEKPCKLPASTSVWNDPSGQRSDQLSTLTLGVLSLRWVMNDRGEKVVAACNDPRAHWSSKMLINYMFRDFHKYQEELKQKF